MHTGVRGRVHTRVPLVRLAGTLVGKSEPGTLTAEAVLAGAHHVETITFVDGSGPAGLKRRVSAVLGEEADR